LVNAIQNTINTDGLLRCVDPRHEAPDAWNRLGQTKTAQFTVTTEMLPYFAAGRMPALTNAWLLVRVKGAPGTFDFDLGGPTRTATKDALVVGLCSIKLPDPLEVTLDAPFTLHSDKAGDLVDGYLMTRYAIT